MGYRLRDASMSDPLSPTQLASQTRALEALCVELNALLADEAGLTETVVLDQSRMGRVSRVDALQQQEMAKATRRRTELRLTRVEAALERVADGEYGECPECGEFISLKRLQAVPESVFCMACMRARGA
jgi:DnaK suppressor protein